MMNLIKAYRVEWGEGYSPRPPRGCCKGQVRGVEGLYDSGRKKNEKGLATTYMQDLRKRKELGVPGWHNG